MKRQLNIKWKYVYFALIVILVISLFLYAFSVIQRNEKYWGMNIGKTIEFGQFEQDGNEQNDKENIEWIIIDENDGKVMLLSKYCLYARTSKSDKTGWKNSKLRGWLNSSFYQKAFTARERETIAKVTSNCYTKEVTDKVFILSNEEFDKYKHINYVAETIPTQFVLDNFTKNLDFINDNCETWLRNNNNFGFVSGYDEIYFGKYISDTGSDNVAAVRPVIWVDVKGLN